MNNAGGARRLANGALNVVAGVLPGLLLCILAALWLRAAQAGPETYLAMQDINLSGRVTAPSCTVRLDSSQMKFSEGDVSGRNSADGEGSAVQTLKLNVSECDADGVGMLFKADHWQDMPERGALRPSSGQTASRAWYYTIGPGREDDAAWPLKLAGDSEKPDVSKVHGGGEVREYYRLSEVNYWYDLKSPQRDGDELEIPLTVSLHHSRLQETKDLQGELNGTFTIQLSWR